MNEGFGKEGVGRDVGMPNNVVVIDEETLYGACDKDAPTSKV